MNIKNLAAYTLLLVSLFSIHGLVWGQSLIKFLAEQQHIPVSGFHGSYCIERHLPELQLPAIAFGCATVDCCSSCQAIDAPWHQGAAIDVSVSGENADRLSLKFENLTPSQFDSLEIPKGIVIGVSEVMIPAGRTRIGVPRDFPGAIVITPVIKVLNRPGGGVQEPPGDDPETIPAGSLNLNFDSVLGELEFGGAGYVTDWEFCSPPTITTCLDEIVLQNHSDTEAAVVLLDGTTDFGCANDVVESGMSNIPTGNFHAVSSCREEAVVFARNKAMHFFDDGDSLNWSKWTDQPGDQQPFSLDNLRIELPLNIQLAVAAGGVPETLIKASTHGGTAESIFIGNRMGIALTGTDPGEIGVVTQANFITRLVQLVDPWTNGASPSCLQVENMAAEIAGFGGIHEPDKLNIYYVNIPSLTGIHFRYCPVDPDQQPQGLSTGLIFVGPSASATTLAHEIGHALSLGHVGMMCSVNTPCSYDYNSDGLGDFDVDNVMFVDFPDPRLFFSEGQSFRANASETSFLNSNSYRSGEPIRRCADWPPNNVCPWMGLYSGAP